MQQTLLFAMQLVERSETGGSSPAMEVSGLERTLQEVKSSSIDTNRLATDRHPSVVKLMREKYSNIEHVLMCGMYLKVFKRSYTTFLPPKSAAVCSCGPRAS